MQSPEESVRSNNSLWVHCRSEKGVGHKARGELGLTVHDGCGGPHTTKNRIVRYQHGDFPEN